MITIKNYQDNKNSVNWSKMPKALQDTRNDVEDIMEFYDDDADIKETVDIFLKQINDNTKPVGEIIVGKLPKIKFVEPKKNEFESLKNGDVYKIINPKITYVWINPDGYDERMVPEKELKYIGKSNTTEDYKRFVDANESVFSIGENEFSKSIKDKLIEKKINRAKIDKFKKENPIEIIDARKEEIENGSILKSEKVNGTKIEISAKGSKFQFSIDGKGSDIGSYDEMLKKYSELKKVLELNSNKPTPRQSKDLYIVKDNKVLTNHGMKDFSFTDNPEFGYRIEDIDFAERMAKNYEAKVVDGFDAMKSKIENFSEKKPKKTTQPKPTKKVQAVVEKRYLDNYSTEFQLIKRFWNVIKDKKIVLEFRKAQLLYAAFNKAAVERKVRKTSEAAEIFNACNQRMKKLFEEFMLPTQSDVKVDFDNATLYNKIQDYVANVTIDPTVGMLKRFISLQNTLPEIKKAETFLKSLQRTKDKFPDSRLSKELSDAIKALQDYIKNPKEPIEVENYGLSKPKVKPAVIKKKKVVQKEKNEPIKSVTIKSKSLKKKPTIIKKTVAKPVQKPKLVSKPVVAKKPVLMSKIKKPIAKLASPVVPLVDVPRINEGNIKTVGKIKPINDTGREQNNFFTVHGQVGKFLQQVERKPFESVVITLDGMQGAGKTTTLYKFIDAFASAGNSSLFISGEEHPESSLAVEKRDKYLSSEAKKHTAIVGDVDSIEQLYQYVKPYDIIFIDSWQKLQRMVGNIRLDEDLRKKFDGKVFVVIFQQTTTGRTKGGAEVVFDGDIIIKMVKEASFADNYAYFDKNRYTRIPIENIRYNIANGEVYNPNEPEPVEQTIAMPVQSGPGFGFQV